MSAPTPIGLLLCDDCGHALADHVDGAVCTVVVEDDPDGDLWGVCPCIRELALPPVEPDGKAAA